MQCLEVSGGVRPLKWLLGVKWLISSLCSNYNIDRKNSTKNVPYPDRDVYGFSQALQHNSRILSQLGHKNFLANPFQFNIHQLLHQ
jgi:hypothetical protein